EAVWRTALLGALVTATLQVATGWEPLGGSPHLRAAPAEMVAASGPAAAEPSGFTATAPARPETAGESADAAVQATASAALHINKEGGAGDLRTAGRAGSAASPSWPAAVALLWAVAALTLALRLGLSHLDLHRR